MKRNTKTLIKNLPAISAYKVRAIGKGKYMGIESTKTEKDAALKELKKRNLI